MFFPFSLQAQVIAQAIGQAFGVAYQQFLQENGMKAADLKPGEYSDYLENQELYNGDLAHFSDSHNIREVSRGALHYCVSSCYILITMSAMQVAITKAPGEILGLAIVESGWGSILPTVVVANLLHGGPAERSGELSIGDHIMSINSTSLVGLPIAACQNIIQVGGRSVKSKMIEIILKTKLCQQELSDFGFGVIVLYLWFKHVFHIVFVF